MKVMVLTWAVMVVSLVFLTSMTPDLVPAATCWWPWRGNCSMAMISYEKE